MKRYHLLFSLNALVVLLVSVERFSITTSILLEPLHFLRLHEVLQISILILATVLISFFLFQAVTDNFSLLSQGERKSLVLSVFFIIGVYFYASGNAFHELASFLFNQYCPGTAVTGDLCNSLFFDDYIIGNVGYFVGAFLMTVSLVLLEVAHPYVSLSQRDLVLLVPNCLIFALAIIAYAGFDRVIVGLVYAILTTLVTVGILFLHRRNAPRLPVTTYTVLTYTMGTIVACIIRFVHAAG